MLRIPLLALPWLFFFFGHAIISYYYYPTVSIFHLSTGSFLLTCRFALYKTLLTQHHFLDTVIFLLLITVKHLRKIYHTNCNHSLTSLPFFSLCQSFFSPHHSAETALVKITNHFILPSPILFLCDHLILSLSIN